MYNIDANCCFNKLSINMWYKYISFIDLDVNIIVYKIVISCDVNKNLSNV